MPLATTHTRQAVVTGQAVPVGTLPATQRLNLSIVLPLRDVPALQALLSDLYDPRSPRYRHYLSVQDFTDRFGPSQADYDAVTAFAAANGMRVTGIAANRLTVGVEASVGAIEQAFHVRMRLYRHPTEPQNFYAPDREPTVALPLWHVSGLDDFSLPHPALSVQKRAARPRALAGSGPGGAYLASDMRTAYYGGTALTGAGQAVAVLEFGGYWSGDVDLYYSTTGQTNTVPINNVLVGGASNCTRACTDDEEVADIVQAIGMAPGLAQLLVYTGNDDVAMFNQMAIDNAAKQISVSWTWTPPDPSSDDPIFQELAAQGQSVFVASGDCGSYVINSTGDCSNGSGTVPALYPPEDPYVTAVGGTAMTTAGAGGPWAFEGAWNGSGGGYADSFALPGYQNGIANAANDASTSLRNVPDVAADAVPDSYYCSNGSCDPGNTVLGGTSLATPRWAGFMALVNQQAAQTGGAPVGFLNPAIYAIGAGASYPQLLHDVTSGSNGGFSAVSGYDLVTGWGSPNGQALIDALTGTAAPTTPGVAAISPTSGRIAGGTSVTITGSNFTGATAVAFGATAAADYLVDSATQIVATAPAGAAGTVDVTVTTAAGTSIANAGDKFTYVGSGPLAPSVSAVSPASGPTGGGNSVTITGGNLSGATAVAFGSVAAPAFVVNSASQITATAPAGNAGTVDVTVTNAGGTSATSVADQYTYVGTGPAGPIVSGLSPASGPVSGGNSVTITGSGLTSATSVSFGTMAASAFTVQSDSQIVATAPAAPAGTVDVTVTTASGTSAAAAGDRYAYESVATPPLVTLAAANGNFAEPAGLVVDSSGNVFVADIKNNAVKEILASGGYVTVTTLATASGNFSQPFGVALDSGGNVFVADTFNSAVKEILAAGGYVTVKILASGHFNYPTSVAVDASGNVFVADWGSSTVKEILAAGGYVTVDTIGSGFDQPYGLTLDGAGNVFVADTGNNAVKEIPAAGGYSTVSTLAPGNFAGPRGLGVDGSGNIFVADTNDSMVKEILQLDGYKTVGIVASGTLSRPYDVALDAQGDVFIADTGDNAVKEIQLGSGAGPSPLVAAILPGARSVETGTPATVFATMLNASGAALSACGAALPETAPSGLSLSFQTTNPATNGLTGTANQPVGLAAGGAQTFLLSLQSSAPLAAPGLAPVFSCLATQPAPSIPGVDTVDLVFSATPIADIIALAATASGDGVVHVSNGAGAFAVATIDAGAAASLTVSADTGSAALPVAITLCQTNAQAQCLAPPAASLPVSFTANATPTFSIFLGATGTIPFAPGSSRIFVRFKDAGGASHGSTSVAVTTS